MLISTKQLQHTRPYILVLRQECKHTTKCAIANCSANHFVAMLADQSVFPLNVNQMLFGAQLVV